MSGGRQARLGDLALVLVAALGWALVGWLPVLGPFLVGLVCARTASRRSTAIVAVVFAGLFVSLAGVVVAREALEDGAIRWVAARFSPIVLLSVLAIAVAGIMAGWRWWPNRQPADRRSWPTLVLGVMCVVLGVVVSVRGAELKGAARALNQALEKAIARAPADTAWSVPTGAVARTIAAVPLTPEYLAQVTTRLRAADVELDSAHGGTLYLSMGAERDSAALARLIGARGEFAVLLALGGEELAALLTAIPSVELIGDRLFVREEFLTPALVDTLQRAAGTRIHLGPSLMQGTSAMREVYGEVMVMPLPSLEAKSQIDPLQMLGVLVVTVTGEYKAVFTDSLERWSQGSQSGRPYYLMLLMDGEVVSPGAVIQGGIGQSREVILAVASPWSARDLAAIALARPLVAGLTVTSHEVKSLRFRRRS